MFVSMYRPVTRRAINGNGFNGLFDTVLNDFFTASTTSDAAAGAANVPAGPVTLARFDVIEKADRFEALVELPGVNKEAIEVQIDGAQVTVKAEAKSADELKEGERVIYAGRLSTRFNRSFELPSEVADDAAEASFENGILKLVLPKKAIAQPKRLAIK